MFATLLTVQGCAGTPRPARLVGEPGPLKAAANAPQGTLPSADSPFAPNPNDALLGRPNVRATSATSPDPLLSFGATPFASEGPLLLEYVSPDGHWLAACQARNDSDGNGQLNLSAGPRGEAHGDALDRYLIAPGQELAIDGLLGADASGRFALFIQHGALALWDAPNRRAQDLSMLGADTRLSAESFAALRTLAFDARSEHLLYVRPGDRGKRLVIRRLSDGNEREFDPGPGEIWRARFDRGGVFAVLEMQPADHERSRKPSFPAPLLSRPRPCSASPGRFHSFLPRPDRPETVLLSLTDGTVIHEPGLVMPVADALLLRDSSGALLLQRGSKQRVLEPAACKARVVHADASRELFIVGCTQKKRTGRVNLELVTASERKPLDIELASVEFDRELSDSPRLLALYPGAETVLFDADHQKLISLRTGDVVIITRGARALIRRGKSLLFYDADSQSEEGLAAPPLEVYPQQLLSPPFVFVSPLLVNLDSASIVGVTEQRALALSNEGRLLVAETEPDSAQVVRGPLRWMTPSW